MLKILSKFICSGFTLGYSKYAPGTVGSIGCFLLSLLYLEYSISFKFLMFTIYTILGLICIYHVVTEDDPGWVVIDEFAGVSLALLVSDTLLLATISLILFRIFDISKILGISKVEELKDPYGVMFDDILAGFYSLVLILIIKCIIY